MQQADCAYGSICAVALSPAQAIETAKAYLKDEGFGVLCEIDIAKAMKEKLGVDIPPHVILGACNPALAHEALSHDANLGLLLPCNVTVREENGKTLVSAVNAERLMEFTGNPALAPMAKEAAARLNRVLDRLASASA